MAFGKHLKEQFCTGVEKRYIVSFIDDQKIIVGIALQQAIKYPLFTTGTELTSSCSLNRRFDLIGRIAPIKKQHTDKIFDPMSASQSLTKSLQQSFKTDRPMLAPLFDRTG